MVNHIFGLFARNFVKGGVLIGIAISIIDYISKAPSLISFYAFMSASFHIIQLYQYDYIKGIDPNLVNNFLIHTVVGGIVYVAYVLLMYVTYNTPSTKEHVISISVGTFITMSFLYYKFIEYNSHNHRKTDISLL